jgi:hypothetical protein
MQYAGVEKVDPEKLADQHELTDALWKLLVERGLEPGSAGRIESYFFADDEIAAASLGKAYGTGDWQHEISPVEPSGPDRVRVMIESPEVALTPEAFHELVDVMMVAALEHRCEFDGFQVQLPVVEPRPWWRIW